MHLTSNRLINSGRLLSILCVLGACRLGALTLTINLSSFSDSFGGGEFTTSSATLSNSSYNPLAQGAGGIGFETFCMEYGEHFSPGSTYDYTISNAAFGGDSLNGFDTVSVGTAWLYSQFATGSLAGYDYSGGAALRTASALQLQLAIWYLEDETTLAAFVGDHGVYTPGASNPFLNAAFVNFGSENGAKSDNAVGGYGFYVLNPTSDGGQTLNQSQTFYRVPDEGFTFSLLATVMMGLLAARRKFVR